MFMQSREAVRVKVKKYDGKLPPELQKFSVDPQITSLEVLQSILAKAFNLKGDFSLSYKSIDDVGQEDYLALFSDWDLDAAFLRAQNASSLHGTEPCVHLRVDVRPPIECPGEIEAESQVYSTKRWTSRQASDPSTSTLHQSGQEATEQKHIQTGLQGIFMNQMEKTLSIVSRALNLSEDPNISIRQPLSDAEFRSFLDPVGQVVQGTKLREVIYCGGIDPSLRRVVWKHILNVYPDGMSGKQRMDYMKKKSSEYHTLRDVWRDCIQKSQVSSDLAYVTSMVKKDVLRTDRHHKFYAGSDDNQNITSLFNILTTYALNHPLVSYCQGMSDLASPLLVTMKDEAHAYICLCALMSRLYPNFLLDGEAMTLKFTHLTESLQVYDPQFYAYLKNQQADDLLFCYRWLLLEMKREFAFEDSLRMLEVLWSSLPPCPPFKELALKDKSFSPSYSDQGLNETPISPLIKTPRDNAYTKLCAMRRQNSSMSLAAASKTKIKTYKRMNQSLDENIGKKNTSPTALAFSKEFQSLDDATVSTNLYQSLHNSHFDSYTKGTQNTISGSSCSVSTVSSLEHEGDLLQHSHATNLPLNPMSASTENLIVSEPDTIALSPEPIPSKTISKENLQRIALSEKLNSSDKLNFQSKHFDEKPSIKKIENFNEFKKLSSSSKINHKVQTRSDVEKTSSENDMRANSKKYSAECSQAPETLAETEFEDSSPDDSKDYSPMTTSITRELKLESEKFDQQLCTQCANRSNTSYSFETDMLYEGVDSKCSNFECDVHINNKIKKDTHTNGIKMNKFMGNIDSMKKVAEKTNYDVFVWENPLHDQVPGMEEIKASLKIESKENMHHISKEIANVQANEEKLSTHESIDALKSICNSYNEDKVGKFKHATCESKQNSRFFSNMSQELENARRNCEVLLSNKKPSNLHSIAATISNFQKKYDIQVQPNNVDSYNSASRLPGGVNACEEAGDPSEVKQLPCLLPLPHVFGGGNPFLMFLCLTVLMQHRDHIMRNQMDYNELAMYFDKMVRKHNVNRVLNQARRMYSQYLKLQIEQ